MTAGPEVHVDWRMTPAEWDELRSAVKHSDSDYCMRLDAEGKLAAGAALPVPLPFGENPPAHDCGCGPDGACETHLDRSEPERQIAASSLAATIAGWRAEAAGWRTYADRFIADQIRYAGFLTRAETYDACADALEAEVNP